MLVFNKYFYKNKKSKLYFGYCVVVLNFYGYGGGGMFISNITYSACIFRKGLPGLKEARGGTLGRGRLLSRTWSSSRRKQRRNGCGSGSMEMLNLTRTNKLQLQGSLEVVGRDRA
jgi:hypothetical protein